MKRYLSQFDPTWAAVRIGEAFFTLGQKGCTTTALCESLGDFDIYINPDELAKFSHLYTRQGYVYGPGLIIWKEVEKWLRSKFPKREISLTRYYGRLDGAIRQHLVPGSSVLLEVANKSHWVKADRKMVFRDDYNCRDPWGGKGCAAIGDYKNITGYAILKIK